MRSKFTVFTGLKQAKFCQTGCFGIGAVAYVIPQVPRGGDSRSLGRSKCLPTRCKLLENLTRSLLLALSKIGGKYSNFTPLWLNIAVEQIRGVMGRGGGDEFFDKQGIQIWEQTKHQQSHLIFIFFAFWHNWIFEVFPILMLWQTYLCLCTIHWRVLYAVKRNSQDYEDYGDNYAQQWLTWYYVYICQDNSDYF